MASVAHRLEGVYEQWLQLSRRDGGALTASTFC